MRRKSAWFAASFLAVAAGCAVPSEPDPCANVACSGHGICFTVVDQPACDCARGFHPDGLTCVPDDPDNPCLGVSCSDHGTCVVSSGVPRCNCESGYSPSGLNCVPSACDPVWSQLFPGVVLDGIEVDPEHGSIYALGNAGSHAVLLQLDACGELTRQEVLTTPAETWGLTSQLVFDGDVLHAIASFEPWDGELPPQSGVLHARLDRTTLDLLGSREIGVGGSTISLGIRDVVVAADGTWWFAGWTARINAASEWENHSLLVREDPAGEACAIEPISGANTRADAAALSGGRVWLAASSPFDSVLRAWDPAGSPADPSCVGGPPVVEETLRAPGVDNFFANAMLADGSDGLFLAGEAMLGRSSRAARYRWSSTAGWTAPEPWDTGSAYAYFLRAAWGPEGELCVAGGATDDPEYATTPDGIAACYDPTTLGVRFARYWTGRGDCLDIAADGADGVLVVCSDWIDSVVRRCLPTGDCPPE